MPEEQKPQANTTAQQLAEAMLRHLLAEDTAMHAVLASGDIVTGRDTLALMRVATFLGINWAEDIALGAGVYDGPVGWYTIYVADPNDSNKQQRLKVKVPCRFYEGLLGHIDNKAGGTWLPAFELGQAYQLAARCSRGLQHEIRTYHVQVIQR